MTAGAKPFMTKFGSPWLEQFPRSRVPAYARQRGPMQTDVVVVGGGLTGCMTAYAFAAAGVKVVLVEAAQIGRGNCGAVSGGSTRIPASTLVALSRSRSVCATPSACGRCGGARRSTSPRCCGGST